MLLPSPPFIRRHKNMAAILINHHTACRHACRRRHEGENTPPPHNNNTNCSPTPPTRTRRARLVEKNTIYIRRCRYATPPLERAAAAAAV